jgi:hypothetical protein
MRTCAGVQDLVALENTAAFVIIAIIIESHTL